MHKSLSRHVKRGLAVLNVGVFRVYRASATTVEAAFFQGVENSARGKSIFALSRHISRENFRPGGEKNLGSNRFFMRSGGSFRFSKPIAKKSDGEREFAYAGLSMWNSEYRDDISQDRSDIPGMTNILILFSSLFLSISFRNSFLNSC